MDCDYGLWIGGIGLSGCLFLAIMDFELERLSWIIWVDPQGNHSVRTGGKQKIWHRKRQCVLKQDATVLALKDGGRAQQPMKENAVLDAGERWTLAEKLDTPLLPPRGSPVLPTPWLLPSICRLLASRTVRESICVVWSHKIWSILFSQSLKINTTCPGCCGSVDCMLACEPGGHWLGSQSGHMPGL